MDGDGFPRGLRQRAEAFLALPDGLGGAEALRDVDVDAGEAERRAVLRVDDRDQCMERADLAAGAANAEHAADARPPLREGVGDERVHVGAVVRKQAAPPVLVAVPEPRTGDAVDREHLLAPDQATVRDVLFEDADAGNGLGELQPLPGVEQRRLGALAFRDVGDHADQADRPASAVVIGAPDLGDPVDAAVRPADAHLDHQPAGDARPFIGLPEDRPVLLQDVPFRGVLPPFGLQRLVAEHPVVPQGPDGRSACGQVEVEGAEVRRVERKLQPVLRRAKLAAPAQRHALRHRNAALARARGRRQVAKGRRHRHASSF